MNSSMPILAVDLHVHSVTSGHAFSTVHELAAAAAAAGLDAIALTDHGPGLPNGPHPYHFSNQDRLAAVQGPCLVLSGVEEDLSDPHGSVYLPERILAQLDVVLVGLHPYGWTKSASNREATSSLLKAMNNPLINGVTHPVNTWADIDVKEVVRAAKPTHTAIEFNVSKIDGLQDKLVQLLEWVTEFDAPLMINSDAHIADEVGVWNALEPFLPLLPRHLIVNCSLASVVQFFSITRPDVLARVTHTSENR